MFPCFMMFHFYKFVSFMIFSFMSFNISQIHIVNSVTTMGTDTNDIVLYLLQNFLIKRKLLEGTYRYVSKNNYRHPIN